MAALKRRLKKYRTRETMEPLRAYWGTTLAEQRQRIKEAIVYNIETDRGGNDPANVGQVMRVCQHN